MWLRQIDCLSHTIRRAMKSYAMDSIEDVVQTPDDRSFKGGIPQLPNHMALPTCTCCNSAMTFFFQIRFPPGHAWDGFDLAFFHCTTCFDQSYHSPVIEFTDFSYTEIEPGYLEKAQTNFRILVFGSGEPTMLREDCPATLRFERLGFQEINSRTKNRNQAKVGGLPGWEFAQPWVTKISKLSYQGGRLDFLLQTGYEWPFSPLPGVPPQQPWPAEPPYLGWRYLLFGGGRMYLIGHIDSSSQQHSVAVLLD
jgi:hypothetical protein